MAPQQAPTPRFIPPTPGSFQVYHSSNLPHWSQLGATYFVTFRLVDSLPQPVLKSFRQAQEDALTRIRNSGRLPTSHETEQFHRLFSRQVEKYLDSGVGACHLQPPPAPSGYASSTRLSSSS